MFIFCFFYPPLPVSSSLHHPPLLQVQDQSSAQRCQAFNPRSVTVTWVPPLQPNGIITNYTLRLWPSSVSSLAFKPSSISTTVNSSLSPISGLLSSTEGADANSVKSLGPTSSLTSPDSNHISTSTFNSGINGSSSPIQGTKPKLVPKPSSSLTPVPVGDGHINSSHLSNTSQATESSTTSVNQRPGPLLQSPDYNATSSTTESFITQDPSQSPSSSSFSGVSDLSPFPLSVTIPGNTTSFTFRDLLPYHTYSLQVLFSEDVDYCFMMAGCSYWPLLSLVFRMNAKLQPAWLKTRRKTCW